MVLKIKEKGLNPELIAAAKVERVASAKRVKRDSMQTDAIHPFVVQAIF